MKMSTITTKENIIMFTNKPQYWAYSAVFTYQDKAVIKHKTLDDQRTSLQQTQNNITFSMTLITSADGRHEGYSLHHLPYSFSLLLHRGQSLMTKRSISSDK
jgi:hypothetical protein